MTRENYALLEKYMRDYDSVAKKNVLLSPVERVDYIQGKRREKKIKMVADDLNRRVRVYG